MVYNISLRVGSLQASSPIWASEASREGPVKGDLSSAPRSCVLARLALLAQTGELARGLKGRGLDLPISQSLT